MLRNPGACIKEASFPGTMNVNLDVRMDCTEGKYRSRAANNPTLQHTCMSFRFWAPCAGCASTCPRSWDPKVVTHLDSDFQFHHSTCQSFFAAFSSAAIVWGMCWEVQEVAWMLRKGLTASQEDNSALFIRRTCWGYAPPKPREAFKHKWIVPTLSLTHLIGLFLRTGVTVTTTGHQLLPAGL